MTELYSDHDLTIERTDDGTYRLTAVDMVLTLENSTVTDAQGQTVLTFIPKNERFWEAKVLMGLKAMIGVAASSDSEWKVRVQGVRPQKVFLGDTHVASRQGDELLRLATCDSSNPCHAALMLILAEKMDQKS